MLLCGSMSFFAPAMVAQWGCEPKDVRFRLFWSL